MRELREEEDELFELFKGRKPTPKERKRYFSEYVVINPDYHYSLMCDLFMGKQTRDVINYWDLIDRIYTTKAIARGFANLAARALLHQKFGNEGLLVGMIYTLYPSEFIAQLPPSNLKLDLILLHAGTVYANHQIDLGWPDDLQKLLNISKSQLSTVREEIIQLYSKVINQHKREI